MSAISAYPRKLQVRSKRVDRDVIMRYAEITDDFNPIHVDEAFAATTAMGGIIAHGMLSLNLIWQSLGDTLGLAAKENVELSVRFTRPVRINDTVSAGGSLESLEGRIYQVWVRNQSGETVIAGTASLMSAGSAS